MIINGKLSIKLKINPKTEINQTEYDLLIQQDLKHLLKILNNNDELSYEIESVYSEPNILLGGKVDFKTKKITINK